MTDTTQTSDSSHLTGDLASRSAITTIAAEAQPVSQIFVDDTGRRRTVVRLLMTLVKLAVVVYSIFLILGVVKVLFGEAIDLVRPSISHEAESESSETSKTILWREAKSASPSQSGQSQLALVVGNAVSDRHVTSATQSPRQPTPVGVSPASDNPAGLLGLATDGTPETPVVIENVADTASPGEPSTSEPVDVIPKPAGDEPAGQTDDQLGEPGLPGPVAVPSEPLPIAQDEPVGSEEPVAEPGIPLPLPDPTPPTEPTDEPGAGPLTDDDNADDKPSDGPGADPVTDEAPAEEPIAEPGIPLPDPTPPTEPTDEPGAGPITDDNPTDEAPTEEPIAEPGIPLPDPTPPTEPTDEPNSDPITDDDNADDEPSDEDEDDSGDDDDSDDEDDEDDEDDDSSDDNLTDEASAGASGAGPSTDDNPTTEPAGDPSTSEAPSGLTPEDDQPSGSDPVDENPSVDEPTSGNPEGAVVDGNDSSIVDAPAESAEPVEVDVLEPDVDRGDTDVADNRPIGDDTGSDNTDDGAGADGTTGEQLD